MSRDPPFNSLNRDDSSKSFPSSDLSSDSDLSLSEVASILREKELKVIQLISSYLDGGNSSFQDDGVSNHIASLTGNYNRLLNVYLKLYSAIPYPAEKEKKISIKASIKYSYDFLRAVLDFLRIIDSSPKDNWVALEKWDALDRFVYEKTQLLETHYRIAARKELDAFHNKDLRDLLESHLSKSLKRRESS